MTNENQYINIREILSRVLRHPLLQDINLESGVQYVIDFIRIVGMPKLFQHKVGTVEIKDYRGVLPCDLISINQVRECKTKHCLRAMTSNFYPSQGGQEHSFRTQGNIIHTSFKEGLVEISYTSIPVDDEGYPMLQDDPIFLRALELYIKKNTFTILFDLGKISGQVLQNTQQEYAWAVAQLQSKLTTPSVSEMESITRMWNTMIQRVSEFNDGFESLGNKEYLKIH